MHSKRGFRYWIRMTHLWLGLTSGLVVIVIAVTGCLYAFQSEIQDLTQPYRFVEKQGNSLPPSVLKAIAEKELPAKKIHAVLYGKPGRAAQVIFFNFLPDHYYYIIYLDPVTGRVIKVKDMLKDFFQIVLDGHFYLWLPPLIGQPVVATFTLIFVVMLISGIILWWPKNKKAAPQRFTIKWKAAWKRRNFDLHTVIGFYASFLALILALTGLVWGFQWFAKSVHAAAGGKKSLLYIEPPSTSLISKIDEHSALDKVWQKMNEAYPGAIIEVHIPESEHGSIAANANSEEGTYWKTNYHYFDQYSLEELSVDHVYGKFKEADAADKLMRLNYDIHTGAILGLPGKILAFFASLLVASLPVTGFFIWYNRNYKEDKRTRKSMHAIAPHLQ